jgi:hypothetical protein
MTGSLHHLAQLHRAFLDGVPALQESVGQAWLRARALATIGRSVTVEEWAAVLGEDVAVGFDKQASSDRERAGSPDSAYRHWRATVLAPIVRARAGQPADLSPYRSFVDSAATRIAEACGIEAPATAPYPWRVGKDVARRTEVRLNPPLSKVTAMTADLTVEADVRWADAPRNTIRQFLLAECCWPHRISCGLDSGVWVSSSRGVAQLAGPEVLYDALGRFARLVGLLTDEAGRREACRYLDGLGEVTEAWRHDTGH